MYEQDKITWTSYEYEYKEKTADWFWAIGIIVTCLSIIAIIYDNPLFAIFMILAGIAISMTAHRKPRIITFEINTKGIKIDDKLLPFSNIKAFWIDDHPMFPPKLLVKSEKFITPVMVIPIETDVSDISTLRTFLLSFVPEEQMVAPMSHSIMNALGF